jgi:hypothetical protein
MKVIAIFVALIFASAASAEDQPCGPGYPADLPCLSGGVYVPVGDVPIPNAKMVVLFYEKPILALYDEFTSRARDAGWAVSEREAAEEPGGVRFRTNLRKGEIS